MLNFDAKKQSISEIILSQVFEEVKVPFIKNRLYNADVVDRFLTTTSSDVEHLEKATKRLYQFYENNKMARVAESNSGPLEEKSVVDDEEMMRVLKSKDQRMDRLQKHMTELFTEAENRADTIVADAELEKEQIILQAKMEAERIISEAQRSSEEIKKAAEEKIREAKLVKYEMDQRAQEIQNEIISKAQQLDDNAKIFSQMSQNLRGLVQGKTA